ncbi:hypothetical protein [Micromonospora endolithica]|uniref:DUF2269 family protein n=1 Tax=Micromonospora endolithica TaxID=230091 RepID=A0A3A9YQN3_9ACTN|nr:hypothetical protein [Micromonospora endolithica]RKN38265.1 hypothetical protein D7223_31280 [Micromonospora endolithica]TWJ25222.1 hypothetical protein JD76_05385 [Micromonospora endolithica]
MTKLLLSVHVLAGIIFIGPVTVAASLFPRHSRAALGSSDSSDVAVVRLLHRICRVYAVLGLAVPAFGLATAQQLGVLTDAWLLVSIGLTITAGLLLALRILPGQQRIMASLDGPPAPDAARGDAVNGVPGLAMTTGVFSLLWAVVVVLMIVRPGSTTGA